MALEAGASEETGAARALALARLLDGRVVAALALAMVLPLLLTTIPPLIDLPGHLGRYAIQTAPAGDILHRYFLFRWGISLNLGVDLIVEELHHLVGLIEATWLAVALIPVLTVTGIAAIARTRNPTGAWALPWALVFVHGYAFHYGFVNFTLAVALSLNGFALWTRFEGRPRLRAALFVPLSGALMVVHAVGGSVMLAMIVGDAVWRARHGAGRATVLRLWPLLGAVAIVALWASYGNAGHGPTRWVLERKFDGLMMAARDQNVFLDIGTVIAAIAVLATGWRSGARMRAPGAVAALALVYLAAPAVLSDVKHIDERLMPALLMATLVLQDWSGVTPRLRRIALASGFALLALRLLVTIIAFAGYQASYTREIQALDHVAPQSRVLAFTQEGCGLADWRGDRLDHLSNFASVNRDAWVNSHWTIEGVQLLHVLYRPSPHLFDDPSQFVWPARCIDMSQPFEARGRHTLAEALAHAPLDRVDYLWLIGALTPAAIDPRLEMIWSQGSSALFRVRNPVPNPMLTP